MYTWKKYKFQYFLNSNLNTKKAFTKTKILPKAEKQFFKIFLIRNWIEKSIHQTKILPKAEKINFPIFLIRISIEKSIRQNQDLAKSLKS